MKGLIWIFAFAFLLSFAYAADVYFIADNDGDAGDVVLMTQMTSIVPPKVYSVHSKMSDEVSEDTLRVSCLNVFIFRGSASVIVGSPNCDNLAEDIVDYLEAKDVPVVVHNAHEVAFDDLRSTLGEPVADCAEQDGVIVYGGVDFVDECIDDSTLLSYYCLDGELMENETSCNDTCIEATCVTLLDEESDTEVILDFDNETDGFVEDANQTPYENRTEEIMVPDVPQDGFVTRLVNWFKGLFA